MGELRRQPLLLSFGMLCHLRCHAPQARDNVKFLSTLERHFKAISSGPLPAIADCLLPLMSALRMVWIMSRHYGELEHSCIIVGLTEGDAGLWWSVQPPVLGNFQSRVTVPSNP